MKAVQVVSLTGPADVEVREVDPPTPGHDDVLVEVHSVGVSFPDLLLSRGADVAATNGSGKTALELVK